MAKALEEAKKERLEESGEGALETVRLELEQARGSLERLSRELSQYERRQ